MTATVSPAVTALPSSWTSKKTMSPSASCAWSVMPTVSVPSASVRTHSCDSVYFRSAGMLIGCSCACDASMTEKRGGRALRLGAVRSAGEHLAVAHERQFYHACGKRLVADLHLNDFARLDALRHARERDRFLHGRRERAARDFAVAVRREHLLVRAQHAARLAVFLVQDQADERGLRAVGFELRLADEIARRSQIDGPCEAGVQRRDAVVHVLAVQVHAGFEAQRVARAEPARAHALALQGVPELTDGGGRQDDFEAVFAGVAGARDHQLAERRDVDLRGVERLEEFGGGARGRRDPPYLV